MSLLAFLGESARDRIPGSLLYRARTPPERWDPSGDKPAQTPIFNLHHVIADGFTLDHRINLLLEQGSLSLSLTASDVSETEAAPHWAHHDLIFPRDLKADIVRIETGTNPAQGRGRAAFWKMEALKLVFHAFPDPDIDF